MKVKNLFDFEKRRAQSELNEALMGAARYLTDPKFGELACRMLWARETVINAVFGRFPYGNIVDKEDFSPEKARNYGYGEWKTFSLVERLHLVQFFIGSELNDDGDPCIGYWRPATREESEQLPPDVFRLLCDEWCEEAVPFIDQYVLVSRYNRKPVREPSKVIKVFDYHEQAHVKSVADMKARGCCVEPATRLRLYGTEDSCCLDQVDSVTKELRVFLEENKLTPEKSQ
jgi:hypothetical protein